MHPKNGTAPQKVQYPMLTEAMSFSAEDGEDLPLFSINAGIPVADAVNYATCLLASVIHVANSCIDRGTDTNDTVALRFLAMASQALLCASIGSIERAEQGGTQ